MSCSTFDAVDHKHEQENSSSSSSSTHHVQHIWSEQCPIRSFRDTTIQDVQIKFQEQVSNFLPILYSAISNKMLITSTSLFKVMPGVFHEITDCKSKTWTLCRTLLSTEMIQWFEKYVVSVPTLRLQISILLGTRYAQCWTAYTYVLQNHSTWYDQYRYVLTTLLVLLKMRMMCF